MFKGCTHVDATPRAFHFDPTGSWLYCAGEETDTLKCYAFDRSTGDLTHAHTYPTGRHPWWVQVVDVPGSSGRL